MKRTIRRTAVVLLAAATAVGAPAAATGQRPTGSSDDTSLTLAVQADASSWDPAVGGGGNTYTYLQAVYEPLFTLNDDLSAGPGLVTEYAYDDAKTTLSLTIRDSAIFSDGTTLDADAVLANLERVKAAPGAVGLGLANIATITVDNPTQLTLTLTKPDPGLLFILGSVPGMIASPAAFESLATNPVGSGPYVLDLDASTFGATYTFTRNESYSGGKTYGFDTVTMLPLVDSNALTNAVLSGQIDVGNIPMSSQGDAEDAGLATSELAGVTMGMFIVDRLGALAPELGDVRVRQAINHALDADGILAAMADGHGTRTTQMFAAGTPAYDEALNERYPYDPDKARQLLAEAGYPDGFTLSLPSENAYVPALYPIVGQLLGEVGIDVEFTPVSTNQITQQFLAGTFPAFMFTYTTTYNWTDATMLLTETAAFNPFHVADETIADLVADLEVADDATAAPLWKELNTYVVEQAWFAPLYTQTNMVAWNPERVTADLTPGQLQVSLTEYQPA